MNKESKKVTKSRKTTKSKAKKTTSQTKLVLNKELCLNPFQKEHDSGLFESTKNKPITNLSLYEDKYFPKDLKSFVGNKQSVKLLKKYINDKEENKLIIIYGPHGVGKTTILKLLLKEYNVVEFNLDNIHEKSVLFGDIVKCLNNTSITQTYLDDKPRVIVIEDIDKAIGDGIYYNRLLDKILEQTNKCKIIATTSNLKKKYKTPTKVNLVHFDYPELGELVGYSEKIAENEKLEISKRGLEIIVRSSRYDIRKILHCFKLLSFGGQGTKIKQKDIIRVINFSESDANFSAYEIVDEAFNGDPPEWKDEDDMDKILGYCHGDQNMIMDLFYSNVDNGKTTLGEISKVLDSLSLGDILHSRMFQDQNWELKEESIVVGCLDPIWTITNRENKRKSNFGCKMRKNYLNNYALTKSKARNVHYDIKNNKKIPTGVPIEELHFMFNSIIKPQVEDSQIDPSFIKGLVDMGINSDTYHRLRSINYGEKVKAMTKTNKTKLDKELKKYETTILEPSKKIQSKINVV